MVRLGLLLESEKILGQTQRAAFKTAEIEMPSVCPRARIFDHKAVLLLHSPNGLQDQLF